MEQDGGPGSAPDTRGSGRKPPPEAKGSAAQPAPAEPAGGKTEPAEDKAPAAAEDQGGGGKEKPTKEKALDAADSQDGGKKEPGKKVAAEESEGGTTEPSKEKTPSAAEAQDGGKKEPAKEKASAARGSEGGKAEPMEQKAPAAAEAQDRGREKPAKEEALAAGEPEGKKVEPVEKALAAAEAQDGGKAEPTEQKASAAVKAEDGDEKGPKAEKALAAAKAEGGKAEETALSAAQAQDGGKEEPAKEKAPAAKKAQDGEKKAAKAEKAPTVTKAQDRGKDPAKDKAPAAAKAQDGGKKAAKDKAPTAAKAQDGGKKAAKAEKEADKPELVRPVLQQSLSCPASCQREEQPWVEATVMEMIPEETTAAQAKESLAASATEPGPAPMALGDLQPPEQSVPTAEPGPALGSAGTQEERTLPEPASAAGQPQSGLDTSPAGAPASAPGGVEAPGPEAQGQLPLPEAEPPPSPYLTPDFGKEDPFEILDDVPPPPAPFAHRIVTLRSANVSTRFNLSTKEILGGGKFGEVHTCTEKETGLKLAAKVIRKQGAKDKEMVMLEIDVMNQLNHRNLIQLYDAIETPREIILFMEFVEGGELFERIIDDDYHLTEVDCMVFVRQICEGIRFMHHMRVLHLDLKPENILCVAATGHMVKIIDFGLARRYNPQEKLKVNFGTPEFLSPEVVNYEQVSYATDMWSMGVITYMLLSGLSPFLGDNDTETLNNVLAAEWYFDEETFESVSEEAKDFVSNLIIKQKSARMSAGQCLKHPWLNNLAEKAKRCNRRLKSQVLLKKYVMRRRWKKNFIGVCAANRFKKITSSGSLTALGV
nr:PREDICTED: myosin light chain kinase 2, skeletal/cardiac muscle [Struthio camelus australis]